MKDGRRMMQKNIVQIVNSMVKKNILLFFFFSLCCNCNNVVLKKNDIHILSDGITENGDICVNFKTTSEGRAIVYARITVIDDHNINVDISRDNIDGFFVPLKYDKYFSVKIKWPHESKYVDVNFCGINIGRWSKE